MGLKKDWKWMPSIQSLGNCSDDCGFSIRTYVNGYIVSTIKLTDRAKKFDAVIDLLGGSQNTANKEYETIVFQAQANDGWLKDYNVPYTIHDDYEEIDAMRYQTSDEAWEGHIKMCEKYDGL